MKKIQVKKKYARARAVKEKMLKRKMRIRAEAKVEKMLAELREDLAKSEQETANLPENWR